MIRGCEGRLNLDQNDHMLGKMVVVGNDNADYVEFGVRVDQHNVHKIQIDVVVWFEMRPFPVDNLDDDDHAVIQSNLNASDRMSGQKGDSFAENAELNT